MPVFQGGREKQVIDRIKSLTNDTALENGTAALFTTIMYKQIITESETSF